MKVFPWSQHLDQVIKVRGDFLLLVKLSNFYHTPACRVIETGKRRSYIDKNQYDGMTWQKLAKN